MIAVECPGCGHAHQFPDAFAGMVMMCTHCAHSLPQLSKPGAIPTPPAPSLELSPPGTRLLPRLREALREAPPPPSAPAASDAIHARATRSSVIPLPSPADHPDLDAIEQRYAVAPPVLASRVTRLGAYLIDYFLAGGALLLGVVLFGPGPESEETASPFVYLFLLSVWGVQAYLLSRQGQSIGKLLLGLQIVEVEQFLPVGFVRGVLLREIVNTLLRVIPLYALVDILFIWGPEERCLHDYIAGTRVVTLREQPAAVSRYFLGGTP